MQLKELSQRTGVSPASIKFYLREGLLPAGRSVHATRAEYAELHVSRLRDSIQALRRVVGLNIAQIGSLLRMADGGVPRLELLAAVQRTVLGLRRGGHRARRHARRRRATPSYVSGTGRTSRATPETP